MTAAEVIALRKALKCTQKDLAARLKVEVGVVQGWEAGTLFPTLKYVKKLAGINNMHHRGTESTEEDTENENRAKKEDSNAEFLEALRKALANPELRAEIIRLAARYK